MDWNSFYGGSRLATLGAKPIREVNEELGDNVWHKIRAGWIESKIETEGDILIAIKCPNNMSFLTDSYTRVVIESENWGAWYLTWTAAKAWRKMYNYNPLHDPWERFEFHWRKKY